MAQYSLTQTIHEPMHILESSVSCIDLAFTSEENLDADSRVHSSLHFNCHHQIVFFPDLSLLSTSMLMFNLETRKSQYRSYKKSNNKFLLEGQTFSYCC